MKHSALHVLFICSRNKWRSPTGEKIWHGRRGIMSRSAGTSRNCKRPVRHDDIRWSDVIFVMEDKHASFLRATFRQDMTYVPMHVLDIPDDYLFMDPELVVELENGTEDIIYQLLPGRRM